MSHIEDLNFDELFQKFIQKFPPAENLQDSQLKFTTQEILNMIFDFIPEITVPEGEEKPNYDKILYDALKDSGYKNEPIEYNEKVTFYWLFMKSDRREIL